MWEYVQPLEVGDELSDGVGTYRVVRVEPKANLGGFGHAWVDVDGD